MSKLGVGIVSPRSFLRRGYGTYARRSGASVVNPRAAVVPLAGLRSDRLSASSLFDSTVLWVPLRVNIVGEECGEFALIVKLVVSIRALAGRATVGI